MMKWFTLPFLRWMITPCLHKRARIRKWVEDDTPMIDVYCPDCGFHDHGHVHGPVEGWVDDRP